MRVLDERSYLTALAFPVQQRQDHREYVDRQRLLDRIDEDGPHSCWLWIGTIDHDGYGRIWVEGHYRSAHRFAYEVLVGPIPNGLQLDHLCRVPSCVNPAHLEPVTGSENTRRGTSPAAERARRTHCPKGHSDYMIRKGRRECRICRKEDSIRGRVERRRRLAEAAPDQTSPSAQATPGKGGQADGDDPQGGGDG